MSDTTQRKTLFQISYPLFIYAMLAVAVTFIDTAILANYSENLAASVSLANQILGVAYDLTTLFSVGLLVLVAQYFGNQQFDEARQSASTGLMASLLLGLVIATVIVIGAPAFTDLVNTPQEVRGDVLIYLYIIAAALVFNGFIMSAQAALMAYGRTFDILLVGLFSNIVYVPLQYCLIYGAFGLPEMGVYGAALSTLVVRGGTIVLPIYMLRKRLELDIFALPHRFWTRSLKMFKLSYPSVAENFAYNLYQLTVVSMIAALGVSSVLTRSYALTLTQILFIVTFVISQGNQVLVGHDKGSGDNEAAFQRGQRTAINTGAVACLAALVLYFSAETLLALLTKDTEIVASVKQILLLQTAVAPLNTINVILFNSLKACGDVNRPVLVNLALTFAIALPLTVVAIKALELGVVGLWYVFIVEETLKAAAMFWLWRGRRWFALELVEENRQAA
ncbi:MAG: MATE family efflux transporter [Pseudomonadota bacterium]